MESNAVSLMKSVSSSSPEVKTRVSSEPMTVDAGSEAAIEWRLGRRRTESYNEDKADPSVEPRCPLSR